MAEFDLRAVQEFADISRRENDVNELTRCFQTEAKKYGFDFLVALSLCDLSDRPEDAIWIDRAPKGWAEVYVKNGFEKIDPYFEGAVKERLPFVWSQKLHEQKKLERVDSDTYDMLDEAKLYGYGDGISIPMLVPGTHKGVVSLTGERPDLSDGSRHTIHLMGIYFFEANLRLNRHALREWKAKDHIALTEREKQTLRLLGEGLNGSEISDVLGISERTVRFHISNAKSKLAANNVTHAVTKAILYGQIEL